MARPEAVSTRILRAVADREGVAPRDLDTPLFDVADPDALESLFHQSDNDGPATGYVVFSYHGYEVTVTSTGTVDVTELTSESASPDLSDVDSLRN